MTLIELITKHEGTRKFPYTDTVGKVTIGVGHNLTDNGLSQAAIDFILHEDIQNAETELDHYVPWWRSLPPNAAMALTDMAFNMGIASLMEFKHGLGFLQSGEYEQAADAFLDSLWARQVGPRAKEDTDLIRGC